MKTTTAVLLGSCISAQAMPMVPASGIDTAESHSSEGEKE